MKQNPMVMNVPNMQRATARSRHLVDGHIRLAQAMANDERHVQRKAIHWCVACFYPPTMSGQACTSRACMSCGVEKMYGNTATDVLCMDCATAHALCKHCGGDLQMREGRRKWPEPVVGTAQALQAGNAPVSE